MKSKGNGATILAEKLEPLARDIGFTKNAIHVVLADGREVSAPLQWFPRLLRATAKQHSKRELISAGIDIATAPGGRRSRGGKPVGMVRSERSGMPVSPQSQTFAVWRVALRRDRRGFYTFSAPPSPPIMPFRRVTTPVAARIHVIRSI